jgi:hypothetical protein
MRKMKRGSIGEADFSSVTAHQAYEHGRRDDLESLGYILVSFLKKLPWALTPPIHEDICIKDPYSL